MTEWLDEHLMVECEIAETKEIADVDLLLDNLIVKRLITGILRVWEKHGNNQPPLDVS